VRITWEEASRELILGCDMKIDVTLVKSSPLTELWLVFGLYFSSITTNFSQFEDVMLNSSRAKFLKFERQIPSESASVMIEENYLKSSNNKCFTGDQKLDEASSLGGASEIDQTYPTLQNEKFVELNDSISKNDKPDINDENSKGTVDNSTNLRKNSSSSTLDKYVTAVDTPGLVLDDSMDDDDPLFYSFDSVSEEDSYKLASQATIFKQGRGDSFLQAENNEMNFSNYELYFESLFLRISSHSTVEDTEAQFESVMAANELLEDYDEVEKDFEMIYKTACLQRGESENHPVSSVTEKLLVLTSNSVDSAELPSEQGNYGINSETSFILQPSVTSTPVEKETFKEDLNSFPLSVSDNPFLPVKMDSGYYESFSPALSKTPRTKHDVEDPKHVKNNLGNLLDFWRGKEKILK